MTEHSKSSESPPVAETEESTEERSRPDFSRFVAVDIETTGLEPSKGEIIEIGAVRFLNGKEKESFRTLVKPVHELPERNRRLTGIDPELLASGQHVKEALEGFRRFVGDDLWVSHNARFDTGFLMFHFEKAGLELPTNPALCTLHLAALINPEADTLQLSALAASWGVAVDDPHRALQDARSAGRIAVRLLEQMRGWSKEFLRHLAGYRGKSEDPLFDLLDYLVGDSEAVDDSWRLDEAVWRCLKDPGNETSLPAFPVAPSLKDESPPSDPELAAEVRQAFERGGVTLLEDIRPGAGAASFAVPPGAEGVPRLVVGVPEGEEAHRWVAGADGESDGPGGPEGAFYLGRRSEYVCLRRAFEADGRIAGWLELSPYERIVLARWLAGTRIGRVGRVNWWLLNNFSGLKGHLNARRAQGLECVGPAAPHGGDCFAVMARSRAEEAARVVVDHRHLFTGPSEGLGDERLIQSMPACLIERADRLGESARGAMSRVLELEPLSRRVAFLAEDASAEGAPWSEALGEATTALKDLLGTSRRTLQACREGERRGGAGPILVDEESWSQDAFGELSSAIEACAERLAFAATGLADAGEDVPDYRVMGRVLIEVAATAELFRHPPDRWAASLDGVPLRHPKRVVLKVEPIDAADAVRRLADETSGGLIATGRRLRYGGAFERICSQWGLGDETRIAERVLEDSSLAYPPLLLPDDVTPPTARSGRRYHWLRYMERTANLLRMLAEALGGRTVAAFSAHHELRKVRELLESAPPRNSIVLAQYQDGTKSAIIREYFDNPATLLLGGRNFLEGVDLRPAGFTALVVVKLPFLSPEEPVRRVALQALEEQGLDGMRAYLVPLAVETTNRWIDSLIAGPLPASASPDSPPGAVILLDPRASQQDWGDDFIGALNARPAHRMPFREMLSILREMAEGS